MTFLQFHFLLSQFAIHCLNNVLKNPYLFYPYEITAEERPDQFSNRYYDDQYKSWILYLSNGMVDPYYEWHLPDSDFDAVLQKKYGVEIYLLQEKVAFYRTNWAETADDSIDVATYDNYNNNIKKTTIKYPYDRIIILYVLALIVALSRTYILDNCHTFPQIILGSILGIMFGYISYKITHKTLNIKN